MTSLLLGLRLSRWGILGFSLAAMISTFIQVVGFYQIAGHTPAERAAFGASMTTLSTQFVALFPAPLRPDTVEGYVQFRGFNPLAILFAVWALASATGFARGDEERGIVESELAAGTTRPALVAARAGAFTIAVVIASAAAGAGFGFGVESGGESVPARGLVEACALLAAVGLSCYALSLLVAQLATARAATALAGALLLALLRPRPSCGATSEPRSYTFLRRRTDRTSAPRGCRSGGFQCCAAFTSASWDCWDGASRWPCSPGFSLP